MILDAADYPVPESFAGIASCQSRAEREIRCEALFGRPWEDVIRRFEIDQFFSLLDGDNVARFTAIEWPTARVAFPPANGGVKFRFTYDRKLDCAGVPTHMYRTMDVGEGEISFFPGEWDDRLAELIWRWSDRFYGTMGRGTAEKAAASTLRMIRASLGLEKAKDGD